MSVREHTKQRRKEKIIVSAEKLFLLKGIDKTTMNDIAKEAGIGVATLFRYFPKKDQIIDLVAAKQLNIMLDRFLEIEKESQTYIEKITQILDFFIEQVTTNEAALPKLLDNITNYTALTDFSFKENVHFAEIRNELFQVFFSMIEEGSDDGTIRSDINTVDVIPTIINNFTVFTFKISMQNTTNVLEPELPSGYQLKTMKTVILDYLKNEKGQAEKRGH